MLRIERWIVSLHACVVVCGALSAFSDQPVRLVYFDPRAETVSVVGSFNQWDPTFTLLDRDARGIWKADVPLPPGRYEYGFLVDGRILVSDLGCPDHTTNTDGKTVSILEVPRSRDGVVTQEITVTYYDMDALSMHVAGTFNDWNRTSHPMEEVSPGLWRASYAMPAGQHPYSFVVDGEFRQDRFNDHTGQVSCVEIFGSRDAAARYLTTRWPSEYQDRPDRLKTALQAEWPVGILDTTKGCNVTYNEMVRKSGRVDHFYEALLQPEQAIERRASQRQKALDRAEPREKAASRTEAAPENAAKSTTAIPTAGSIPITFLYASKATLLIPRDGDRPGRIPLEHDKDGVWSATIHLQPGRYPYQFQVGVNRIPDPRNPRLAQISRKKRGSLDRLSIEEIEEAIEWDPKKVRGSMRAMCSVVVVDTQPRPESDPSDADWFLDPPEDPVYIQGNTGIHPFEQELFRQGLLIVLREFHDWRIVDESLCQGSVNRPDLAREWLWSHEMYGAEPYLVCTLDQSRGRLVAPMWHPITDRPQTYLSELDRWIRQHADTKSLAALESASDRAYDSGMLIPYGELASQSPWAIVMWINAVSETTRTYGFSRSICRDLATAYADLAFQLWDAVPAQAPVYAARAVVYANLARVSDTEDETMAYVLAMIGRPEDARSFLPSQPDTVSGIIASAIRDANPAALEQWIGDARHPLGEETELEVSDLRMATGLSELDIARLARTAGDLCRWDRRFNAASHYYGMALELQPDLLTTWWRFHEVFGESVDTYCAIPALRMLCFEPLWRVFVLDDSPRPLSAFPAVEDVDMTEFPSDFYAIRDMMKAVRDEIDVSDLHPIPAVTRWGLLRDCLQESLLHLREYTTVDPRTANAASALSHKIKPLEELCPELSRGRSSTVSTFVQTQAADGSWTAVRPAGSRKKMTPMSGQPRVLPAQDRGRFAASDVAWDLKYRFHQGFDRVWPAIYIDGAFPAPTIIPRMPDRKLNYPRSFAYQINVGRVPKTRLDTKSREWESHLRKAIEIAPYEADPYEMLAGAYLDRERFEDVIDIGESYLRWEDVSTKAADLVTRMAHARLRQGELERAHVLAELAADASTAAPLLLLAQVYDLRGDHEQAKIAYKAYDEVASARSTIWFQLRTETRRRVPKLRIYCRQQNSRVVRAGSFSVPEKDPIGWYRYLLGDYSNAIVQAKEDGVSEMSEALHLASLYRSGAPDEMEAFWNERPVNSPLLYWKGWRIGELAIGDVVERWIDWSRDPCMLSYLLSQKALRRGDLDLARTMLRAALHPKHMSRHLPYTLSWIQCQDLAMDPAQLALNKTQTNGELSYAHPPPIPAGRLDTRDRLDRRRTGIPETDHGRSRAAVH